jgi:hypothetical protein
MSVDYAGNGHDGNAVIVTMDVVWCDELIF